MPLIRPIHAIRYATEADGDISTLVAPPYDVLDASGKRRLLETNPNNVVAIDLPHLPAKTAGPDAVYDGAARTFRQWLQSGVLKKHDRPVLFVYQQTYTAGGKEFKRRGIMANVAVQPFGRSPDGHGGIYPHEQTFSGPKEDRMKLMCATRAQLSPIFGLHSDPDGQIAPLLSAVVESGPASFWGQTSGDEVRHEVWIVDDPNQIVHFSEVMLDRDVFIADGHHRYTTAINYRQGLMDGGQLSGQQGEHPAHDCLFVLVAMQDPGMIVLPTHRVLGGMDGFSVDQLAHAAKGVLTIKPFPGSDLEALEAALPKAGAHAMGLYDPTQPDRPLAIATTDQQDPLGESYPDQSVAWRMLDVAVLQHLIVERLCQPQFCPPGQEVGWKFPHSLSELRTDTESEGFQLGVVMQPTPLESVRQVSEAGELMPQKSTYFYPKLATGLVIHPLEA